MRWPYETSHDQLGSRLTVATAALHVDACAHFELSTGGDTLTPRAATGFPPRLTTYTDGAFASGRLEDVFDPDQLTLRGIIGSRTGSTMRRRRSE